MPGIRYGAQITAGSLKLHESRRIADYLLRNASKTEWDEAIGRAN